MSTELEVEAEHGLIVAEESGQTSVKLEIELVLGSICFSEVHYHVDGYCFHLDTYERRE